MRRRARGRAALAVAAWLCVTPSRADEEPAAQDPAAAPPPLAESPAPAEAAPAALPAPPAVDGRALASLTRMVDALADAQSLHVVVEDEYDVVQESGETLSFARVSDVTVRRPDRLRIETTQADGARRVLGYDGRFVTLYDPGGAWFAAASRETDVDALLAFVRDQIGVELPLGPLFSTGLRGLLLEGLTSATFVGRETQDGEPYDHLALRYGDVGLQLWIASAGDALPRRLTLTFEGAPGGPQLHADFRAWDLEPDLSEWDFAFAPPAGVRALPFALQKLPDAAEGSAHVARIAANDAADGAAGGLVALERVRAAARSEEAESAARDTAARLEQAASRPGSGRKVIRRRRASSEHVSGPESGVPTPEATRVARWDELDSANLRVVDLGDIDWGTPAWLELGPGTALSPRAFEHMTAQPGCNVAWTEAAGRRYARCHGTWWVEAVARGQRAYVAVGPPPGSGVR
jgi:hypothetical protein